MTDRASDPSPDPQQLERIALAFPELVGGFEVLERELELDGQRIADLLAYSQGRLLLVSLVDGNSEACVLRALDALGFAHAHGTTLGASLPRHATGQEELAVVLVAREGFGTRQLERLAHLRERGVWLLRQRLLRTERGTHTRLEPVALGGTVDLEPLDLPAWAIAEPQRSFLSRVDPDRLELAIALLDRLRRVEPDAPWTLEEDRLVLRLGEQWLCDLGWEEGELELRADPELPGSPVREPGDLDRAVDEVLGATLERASRAPVPAPTPAGSDLGSEPPTPLPELPEEARGLEEPLLEEPLLEEVELHPMAPGPLLTREEIEAFQE